MAGPSSKPDKRGQLAALRTLIAALSQSNPFYSARLSAAGIGGNISSVDEFLKRMPVTRKQELIEDQRAHPPYGSNLTYPIERYTRLWQTSSTSGNPLYWLDTKENCQWMLDNWARVYQAAGVGAGDRIFFAFSFGLFLGFWTAFESAVRAGFLCIPGGGMGSAARLRTIVESSVTVLCCTPTYALRLAEVAAQERIDLVGSKVRRIIVAGEPGGSIPHVRASIEAAWPGARVVDHHGMTETGPVSYGCPALPCTLHVIESSFIAEIVDPLTGQPSDAGELVLTNLGRLASPLLRYRTGDLVERADGVPCACGSYDLALRGGILGRSDDMVVVRGVNVYPSGVENILRACGGVAEYRVEIHTGHPLAELRIQLEPAAGCEDPERLPERVQAALHQALGLRIPVRNAQPGALPRFEMKAQRWVRLRS